MKKLQIFEGAVCASDGMCGLSVDQELMRIDTVVKVLQNNAYDIDRYIMPGDRKAFLENEVAGEFLRQNGNEALPLILLNGEKVLNGRFPTNDEIAQWLEVPNLPKLLEKK